ncbi:hypothetical protein G6F35_012814 [Rhizopus arrhizus]|nr:hypothetical protein G6F35_012814 [Rhizopus arrhizus]
MPAFQQDGPQPQGHGAQRQQAADPAGRVVQRRGQALRIARHVHQAGLQHGAQRPARTHQEHIQRDQPDVVRHQREQRQHHGRPQQQQAGGAHHRAVGKDRHHHIADRQAHAERAEHERHDRRRHLRDGAKRVGQIRVDREQAAETNGADGQRDPDLAAAQRAQFAQRAGLVVGGGVGRKDGHADHCQHGQQRHQGEAPAPADHLAHPVGQGHANDGGDGQPEKHAAHGHGAPVGGHERTGHQRRNAESGAIALRPLPMANSPIRAISSRRRGILAPSTARIGAPTTTPSA